MEYQTVLVAGIVVPFLKAYHATLYYNLGKDHTATCPYHVPFRCSLTGFNWYYWEKM